MGKTTSPLGYGDIAGGECVVGCDAEAKVVSIEILEDGKVIDSFKA